MNLKAGASGQTALGCVKQDRRRWVARPLSLARCVLSLAFLAVVVFAFAGCSVSSNTSSSMQTSAGGRHIVVASYDTVPADDPTEGGDELGLSQDGPGEEMVKIADPLEPVNRLMFGMNDRLYFWVIKPIAQAYKDVMPEPVRVGIRNFFSNVSMPGRLVNCLLQGKNAAAATELQRFAINSTVGVLGFGDPALDQHGLKPAREDLGQTLAVYGLEEGFYIVWPLLGPSTVRDTLGMAGGQFLNPIRYVDPHDVSIGISVVNSINASSFRVGTYEQLMEQAPEPYVAMRTFYVQYRNKQIQE